MPALAACSRLAPAAIVVLALAGSTASAGARAPAAGSAPPEIAANAADGWPEHNFDLSNSRADLHTAIDAANVATLKQKWAFKLSFKGLFGAFTTNPIVLGGVVYFEDPDSDVFALRQATGKVIWEDEYDSATPSGGPNGVALGYGLLYGETESSLFALDPKTGKQVWIHRLISNAREGIDMAPQLYDGKVLISTVPGNSTSFYTGGAWGIVYALDAKTGKTLWSFSTVKGGGKLWGDPKENSGGGLWYPPAVDSDGRVFLGVANPGPFPDTQSDPNAKSRPGPNLYMDSLVALDGSTGKLLWYRQVTPHDVRDYDFQISPIVSTQMIAGRKTEIVVGAGKSGKVVAFRADDGERLWTLNIGKHNAHEYGPFPATPVLYCPGSIGGVETPMAESGGALYVPWIDLCLAATSTGYATTPRPGKPTGGIAAVAPATGAVIWKRIFPSMDTGAATVADDVVFTATYDGTIYALSTKTGRVLWTTKAPAGINSFPAITKRMLIVGAGAAGGGKDDELVAYSLGGR